MIHQTLLTEAKKYQEQLIRIRRYLHVHPGTGFDLSESFHYVEQQLQQLGYAPQKCGKCGCTALVGNKPNGKVFLLRADMDALPLQEEADISFRSHNGNMHACGHDMHTAMLLGAAKLLKDHENELNGTVKLMFQPAEEIFEGSQNMIEDGLLENPHVDAALMIHVISGIPLKSGTVIISAPGISAPAADYFHIQVQGSGCHASMPHTGIDPLTSASHILIALQEISARELSMTDRAILTIGTLQGGSAANAIPDTAIMKGSIRTFDEEIRTLLKQRLTDIATSIATAFRCRANIAFENGCPSLINDSALSLSVESYMKELLGEEYALAASSLQNNSSSSRSSKIAGSEDFAYVSRQVPSIMLALAAGEPQKGYAYPQHHPKVTFDETVLPIGSAVYAYAAMRWLFEHSS